jgi:hypothetical protein
VAVAGAPFILPPSIKTHPFLVAWLRAVSGVSPAPPLPDQEGDWPAIIDAAACHGLAPSLLRWFCRDRPCALPVEARSVLHAYSVETAARNLWLVEEFTRIDELLARQSVRSIPLRGVFLSQQLYGDVTVRPTGDIDLLVERDALPAVRAALVESGLAEVEARDGFAERYYYTLEFFKSRPIPLIVEPHWSLSYPPFVDSIEMAPVWGRAVWSRVGPRKILALGREDLVMHLCLHLLHHIESAPLLWYAEIDQIIRNKPPLDWQLFMSQSQRAGLEQLIATVLEQVQRVLDTPVPWLVIDRWSSRPSQSHPESLLNLAIRSPEARGREKILMFWSLQGVRAKLRYLLNFLFPSCDFIRTQYGVSSPRQVGVVYVRRLGTLVWEGSKTLAKLIAVRYF